MLGDEGQNGKSAMGEVADAVFVIQNTAADSPIARLEHNTRTGIVKFFDRAGKVVGEKQLTDSERAWLTPDPLAEKYYPFSPYAFCLNNPLRFIDPNGMDVWEIDHSGNIINRIKDKTQDAFHIVKQMGEQWQRVEGQSLSFEYGTVTGLRTPTVTLADGTSAKLTMFEIEGDNNATQLFEFMGNTGVTTNVEWSHVQIGSPNSGRNIVGNTYGGNNFSAVNDYVLSKGYTVKTDNHSHVYNSSVSDADKSHARRVNVAFPDATLNNYYRGVYTQYDQYGQIMSAPTIIAPVIVRPR